MKKQSLIILFLFALALLISACEDFTSSVDPFIDRVKDEQFDVESQVPFLINGVKARFSTAHDMLVVDAELLSDAMFFDSNLPGATYPTFAEIDDGDIQLDNSSVHNPTMDLGELRFFSDNLVERVEGIEFDDASLRQKALFTGYLYGGVARYFIAGYFGLNEEEGGGTIDNGPFIPSNDMYQLAIEKLQAALQQTTDEAEIRLVNSLIARCYLIPGDYSNAQTLAENGMIEGDAPFQSEHSTESDNYFWQQAGGGRTQAGADDRFKAYIDADPAEANRVLLAEVIGNDDSTVYNRQNKYPVQDSPLPNMTWQENELMLAELALRSGNAAGGLAHINAVRASHGISDLAAADMLVLIEERDKELSFTGMRVVDQRRLDSEYSTWHLPAGTWRYLPIVERERNINPNIN